MFPALGLHPLSAAFSGTSRIAEPSLPLVAGATSISAKPSGPSLLAIPSAVPSAICSTKPSWQTIKLADLKDFDISGDEQLTLHCTKRWCSGVLVL